MGDGVRPAQNRSRSRAALAITTSFCSAVRSASPIRAVFWSSIFSRSARSDGANSQPIGTSRIAGRLFADMINPSGGSRSSGRSAALASSLQAADAAGGDTISAGGSIPRRGSQAADTRPIRPEAVA